MNKVTKRKTFIVVVAIAILLIIAIPTSVYAYNNINYNKYFNLANDELNKEQFDASISDFKKSLNYNKKRQVEVDKLIDNANLIKESKITFEQASSLQNDKKYLESIDIYKKIPEGDNKYYNQAKENITTCGNEYINENIAKAKSEADNKNYDSAISYLDLVLKFDDKQKEASELKVSYNNEIAKIQQAEEDKKKAELAKKSKAQNKTSGGSSSKKPNNGIYIPIPEPRQYNSPFHDMYNW
ncbi:hypothetical protein [Clostridium sp. YIM B02551]|uniref:hypothetical protein n=1 Tax=Clostridium sp. YIM B02551 TaxID=2910679 RepID=UPI001EEAACB4|nr:hypothetical protein [Clostridium sp. YIM B02551]